jgi:hypothetical protein
MNILAVSGAAHLPPRGGFYPINRAWLEQLAAQGHICRVLAPSLGGGATCATNCGGKGFPPPDVMIAKTRSSH